MSLRLPFSARGTSIELVGSRSGRDWVTTICAGFIVFVVLIAILAPWIAPHDPTALDLLARWQPPSAAHLLGTDSLGRDILSRLIMGARLTLLGPFLIIMLATTAGTIVAITSAWVGGWFDTVVSRGLDILFAFPGLILALLAVALFGTGLVAPVVALAIAYLPYIARVLRSGAIRQRNMPYISAVTVEGLPSRQIMLRHLFPNIMGLVLVQATLSFGYAVVDLAAVSFLGLGVQPPSPEWGLMVATGQSSILSGHPQESLYAGLCIVATVVAFNVLGDRLASRLAEGRS
jgi:peptide/nickel transport system permease protein